MITTKLRFVETDEENSSLLATEQKERLRTYMKARRGENENRDGKERLLIDNFFSAVFDETKGAGMRRTFFVYLSRSSEAPTDLLIERLKEKGQIVCCPQIINGDMRPVLYGEDFSIGEYGIREPIGEVYDGEIAVAVIPLLAVDRQGNRLGYGGGYYDKFLAQRPNIQRIAYCYDFQICNAVPRLTHDQKMDMIVTDKQTLPLQRK